MLRRIAEAFDRRHERKSLERLATAFNEQMQVYACADAYAQIFTEMSARTVYHAFVANYPEIRDFLEAPRSEKSTHLGKLSNYVEQLAIGENSGKYPQGVTNGAVLTQCWIAALAWKDFELADAMAEQLEPLNRAAYETACAAGDAMPDENVISDWKEMFGENIDTSPEALKNWVNK